MLHQLFGYRLNLIGGFMKFSVFVLTLFFTVHSLMAAEEAKIIIPKNLEFGAKDRAYFFRARYLLPSSETENSGKTLFVLGCEIYAYNSLERAYIVDKAGVITDVYVLEVNFLGDLTATNNLMGSDFDTSTNTLHTFMLGRGMGDCGSSASYLYDMTEEKFVLKEARIKNSCDGDSETEWPVVYSK
jgi:hypothetical protein